jgi:hypothetical protein
METGKGSVISEGTRWLLEELSSRGISVRVEGSQGMLVLSPASAIDDPLAVRIREAKPELLRILGGETKRPASSVEAIRKFGSHGLLFPFIGRRVWTPRGFGELYTVSADRVEVRLERSGVVARFKPVDVVPDEPL